MMKTAFTVPSVAALLGLGFLIGAATLEGKPPRHLVTVTGESRLIGEPDTARLLFGVEERGRTVAEAQAKMATGMNKVIAALQQSGVKKEDISTSQLNISQAWDYARKRPGGYVVSATVTLVARDVHKVGFLVDRAAANGLNRLQGVSYDVLSQDWRKKGLQAALTDAHGKADSMAGAAGQRLGKVVSVREAGQEQASPEEEYDGRWPATLAHRGAAEYEPPVTRALPGQRTFTTRVQVVYELG